MAYPPHREEPKADLPDAVRQAAEKEAQKVFRSTSKESPHYNEVAGLCKEVIRLVGFYETPVSYKAFGDALKDYIRQNVETKGAQFVAHSVRKDIMKAVDVALGIPIDNDQGLSA